MTPLSYLEIARCEEHRQALSTAEVAEESVEVGGGWMAFGGVGSWANQACGLGLSGGVGGADLDALVEFYVSRGVEPKLEVCPFADPSLLQGLAARGFELREFENVLARELDGDDVWAGWPHPRPDGLTIRRVDPQDAEDVRTSVEVSASGFVPPNEPVPEVMATTMRRVVEHPRCDSYLAFVDGEAAGAAGVETLGEVACLFGTSVLPAFRRRGIQAALIARRLERGRERGARLAVIHSRPGIPTERNAARLGFFMAYSKAVLAKPGPGLERSP